ncbi:unnamed protein product [Notodromas monacha]|uniref:Uncharacterized protein n=1 Tax=Notodromas monacha TaxID=399045 RepID=A0A7R9G9V0_9CRUS|nr:unnamed protein product [Notodromas monacha]CAG0913337.1 unnamed protein product [Notodromas monacha]
MWGFSLPPEAGYPVNSGDGPRYLMMETHFDNRGMVPNLVDNSGLRFYYTPNLRAHDAGVMSLGMHPNWRHLIPPGQSAVLSQGHCTAPCTSQI